jgi:hypothetical protein
MHELIAMLKPALVGTTDRLIESCDVHSFPIISFCTCSAGPTTATATGTSDDHSSTRIVLTHTRVVGSDRRLFASHAAGRAALVVVVDVAQRREARRRRQRRPPTAAAATDADRSAVSLPVVAQAGF